MSLILLIGAIYMFQNGIAPETDYLIVWALFAIADALWFGRCKND